MRFLCLRLGDKLANVVSNTRSLIPDDPAFLKVIITTLQMENVSNVPIVTVENMS